jgi:hypothetical protein
MGGGALVRLRRSGHGFSESSGAIMPRTGTTQIDGCQILSNFSSDPEKLILVRALSPNL